MAQHNPTLAEAMYGHLTKAKEKEEANEEVKAKSRKLAADLRELRQRMERERGKR